MKALLNRPRSQSRIRKTGGRVITRILVPIDFSRNSTKAIPHALAISRQLDADVHFVHVVDGSQALPPTTLMWKARSRLRWKKQIFEKLEAVASKYTATGDRFTVHEPLEGSAPKEICERARELKADLIVIATHGRTGFERAFFGSTAESILRFSPCPVLVVRRPYPRRAKRNGAAREKGLTIRRVVIPIDFSAPSQTAFELGVSIASGFGAAVILVHVVPQPLPVGGAPVAAAMLVAEKDEEDHAYEKMRAMAEEAGLSGSVEIARGAPAKMICECAAQEEADLIIISTHGLTGLRHLLMGSVAQHVVRYANCPVLVIPAGWGDFKARGMERARWT